MPRYFITTSDGFAAHDDEGLMLPDAQALAKILRQSLASIMLDEGVKRGRDEFWAEALDEGGRRVMTANIKVSVAEP